MLNVELVAPKGAELCTREATIQGRPFVPLS